ncbi:MAG: SAM-dependent methyltransferase [Verrucomicrobiaceae bacterium]|nr:SAM-dependent methyltransferase [Verrucomicrobiaceae bacterium]
MFTHSTDQLHALLSELHEQSETQLLARARKQFPGSDAEFLSLARRYNDLAPRLRGKFLREHGLSSEDSDASQGTELSLSVSAQMGNFLRNMVLTHRPQRILELGSSYGVSTLYFADALNRLGNGTVVATELDPVKCTRINEHVSAMGLANQVELKAGDVFKTIAALDGVFDFVFIDIWASGYLDAFKNIERLLRPGSIVLADNMFTAEDAVKPFKHYVDNNPAFSSTTLDFESGVEFTVVL